jgi:hypothetical protein
LFIVQCNIMILFYSNYLPYSLLARKWHLTVYTIELFVLSGSWLPVASYNILRSYPWSHFCIVTIRKPFLESPCYRHNAHNPSLNNFWFVDKTNKDKLIMKLSGAVTISIYYLSIIHHHIHIIIHVHVYRIFAVLVVRFGVVLK